MPARGTARDLRRAAAVAFVALLLGGSGDAVTTAAVDRPSRPTVQVERCIRSFDADATNREVGRTARGAGYPRAYVAVAHGVCVVAFDRRACAPQTLLAAWTQVRTADGWHDAEIAMAHAALGMPGGVRITRRDVSRLAARLRSSANAEAVGSGRLVAK